MNRSVLLVICDFLILTLLSFVRFDNATAPPVPTPAATQDVSAPGMSSMLASLEASLEAERRRRELLTNALALQNAELASRIRLLAEREERLTNVQQRLSQAELEARNLANERSRLEQSRNEAQASVEALHRAFEVTQRGAEALQERLTDTTREAAESKARLQSLEEELGRARAEAEAMQQRISKLDDTRESLTQEKQKLMVDLGKSEVEARMAHSQLTNLNVQLASASREKVELIQTASRLATNVSNLSEQSSAIRHQIERQTEQSTAIREQIERQTRLPANTIYSDFLSNRVTVATTGITRGLFGQDSVRRHSGGTVLVRNGGRVFAILHVDDTALRIWPPDAQWISFTADLSHGNATSRASEFALLRREPRVALVPVDSSATNALGAQVFEVATDPSSFAEAVVIGGEEAYYGECGFHLNAENPGYIEMQRSTIRRLLGEFAPRRGDLAFTKTGLFLGILVNSDHCLLLNELETLPPFRCGPRLDAAANSAVLRRAQATLERQPTTLR